MSLNVIPRAFGTCLVDISNACSDFFTKRMNKVENQKVDDSAHLAHASSTLDKSRTIPVDGKWHCVKSESKNITNAEIQRYIREDKGLGDFRIDKVYSARSGIHTTYFKCAFSSKCNCSFKIGRSEDSDGNIHTTVEVKNPVHIDHPQEDVRKKRVVPPNWTSAVKESVREDVNNQKSVKVIGVTLGYHKNAEYMKKLKYYVYNSRKKMMNSEKLGTKKRLWSEWMKETGGIDFRQKHKPYAVAMRWPTDEDNEQDDFIFLISSPEGLRNMRKQVKPGEVYWSFDGTHGTNNHNYALITVNTFDMQRQVFPVAFAICNAERETNMTWVGEKLQEEIAKHSAELGCLPFTKCTVMADAHESYKNSSEQLGQTFGFDANVLMCIFHVKQAIKKKFSKHWKNGLSGDINALWDVPSGMIALFKEMEKRMLEKWSAIDKEFVAYYKKEWLNRKWSRCYACVGYAMTNNGTESQNKSIKNTMGYKRHSDLGILAKAAWEIFEAETTKAAVKTFYSIDTPAKIQLERWEQYNEYEQDFNEFEPEDDSSDDKYVPRRAYRYEYKAGYLYASRALVSRLQDEAASKLRRGGSVRSQGMELRKLLEQRRDAFVRYWDWASDPDFNPKAFSLSFDDWKSLSSDFHVVTPLRLTPQPEKGSILECFGDIPWCCTCTRKIERGIGGYQNTRCCLHVMHASITVSGMKDPPDLRNDLIGKQKRGRKRIHGRQARTNRYGVTVHKPAKKRKVNKE